MSAVNKLPNPDLHRGLEGIIVDSTSISKVNPDINSLIYYGYPIQELSEACSYEEIAYLLLHGELPNPTQLNQFTDYEKSFRYLSSEVISLLNLLKNACPMDALRTAVSFLSLEDYILKDKSIDINYRRAVHLLSIIPLIIATHYRIRNDLKTISPKKDVSLAENFFHMCFDQIPPKVVIKSFNISLILYAEHTFNASTFTARVISSSLSDMYSAVTGAIGSLKGPLHGGANEAVMQSFLDISDPKYAKNWTYKKLSNKEKIMGFGHRVYKNGDSRVPTMKNCLKELSEWKKNWKWYEIYEIIESIMVKEKNIYPNLDFPTGPSYYLMDFDMEYYTPIFVISRISGWTAHIMEQIAHNRLIRPLSQYIGPDIKKVIPLKDR